MMAPPRPTELHQHQVRLAREPAAAAEARRQIHAVIGAWQVRVDPDIAVLLTSDLVTSAIMHGNGQAITLAVRCSSDRLRVDCFGASSSPENEPAARARSHGLALVATLATEWGSFGTPVGRVTYFTLALDSALPASFPPAASSINSKISEGDT